MFVENFKSELMAAILLRFWIKYVADAQAIVKGQETGRILEKLNQAHQNIEFNMEIEKKRRYPS